MQVKFICWEAIDIASVWEREIKTAPQVPGLSFPQCLGAVSIATSIHSYSTHALHEHTMHTAEEFFGQEGVLPSLRRSAPKVLHMPQFRKIARKRQPPKLFPRSFHGACRVQQPFRMGSDRSKRHFQTGPRAGALPDSWTVFLTGAGLLVQTSVLTAS